METVQPLREIDMTRREYRLSAFQKHFSLALAAALFCCAGFGFKLASVPMRPGRGIALLAGFFFLISGFALVSRALRSRLMLEGNWIELRSALRTFIANRNEIEGLRKIENRYDGRWTRIYLKENRGSFDVSTSFAENEDLNEWLKGVPDLDERHATQLTEQIRSQDSLGATPDERMNTLKRAKAWMIGLSIAAGLATIPLIFVDYTPLYTASLILLVLSPPLAILLLHRSPLLFTLSKRKTDPRADMTWLIMWPGMAMGYSYLAGRLAHVVDPSQLIVWALLALLCYSASLFRIVWNNPSRSEPIAMLLIVGPMYIMGLINAVNTLADRSAPRVYRTEILSVYKTHGRHPTSNLILAPWGPIAQEDDISVPEDIYQQAKVGDLICVGLHPGFLHASWYTLTPCPE